MEPPPGPTARRRLSLRGACLAVALLCTLAATTGAIARSGDSGGHHHHAVAAATAGIDTVVAHGKRGVPDLAPAERPVPDAAAAPARSAARSTAVPTGAQAAPVRTRGPPVTA
ncbi:MAG TPA: hypothetical protein VIG48_05385 [Jatrophihabitans sp.]|jgi:hypothetical protein